MVVYIIKLRDNKILASFSMLADFPVAVKCWPSTSISRSIYIYIYMIDLSR